MTSTRAARHSRPSSSGKSNSYAATPDYKRLIPSQLGALVRRGDLVMFAIPTDAVSQTDRMRGSAAAAGLAAVRHELRRAWQRRGAAQTYRTGYARSVADAASRPTSRVDYRAHRVVHRSGNGKTEVVKESAAVDFQCFAGQVAAGEPR
jgi:hypothetical protein